MELQKRKEIPDKLESLSKEELISIIKSLKEQDVKKCNKAVKKKEKEAFDFS
ncbi:hypothetical protein AVEN_83639-1, partial [Araneus ventricosus]